MICPHCKKVIPRGMNDKQKQKVRELRKQGYSFRDIQEAIGVSYVTASRFMKKESKK